jgi:sortase A
MSRTKRSRGRFSFGVAVSLGFLALGIGCIGVALINIGAGVLASADAYRSLASIPATSTTRGATSTPDSTAAVDLYPRYPATGDVIGSLSIPALKQRLPIIQGTRDADLERGVGHFVKSVLPGEDDNCVLSGHRDTVFTRLGKLKIGDRFITKTSAGTFTYKIRRIRIVGKNDRTVIVHTNHAVLTVSTCYPFYFIGSAPKRYVLIADLVASSPVR